MARQCKRGTTEAETGEMPHKQQQALGPLTNHLFKAEMAFCALMEETTIKPILQQAQNTPFMRFAKEVAPTATHSIIPHSLPRRVLRKTRRRGIEDFN